MRDPIKEEREKNELLSSVKNDFGKGDYVSVVRGYEILDKYYPIYSYEVGEIMENLRKITNYYLHSCEFPDEETLITLGELLLRDDWTSIREDSALAYALFNECFWSEHLSDRHKLWMSYCHEQLTSFDYGF